MEEIKKIKSEKSDIKKFGLTVGTVFMLLAAILWYSGKATFPIYGGIGLFLLGTGVLLPELLKPIHKGWMVVATVMGWFMSRLILTVFFFAIFTPISLIGRLFGAQFLDLKWDKNKKSYWQVRDRKEKSREDLERQF